MKSRRAWIVPGVVLRVVDGDTFRVDLDLGWGVKLTNVVVRVANINCPEMDTGEGQVAAARTGELLPAGTEVTIVSHKLDKYGRVLATVVVGGVNLGSVLVNEGHAVPYLVEPDGQLPTPPPPPGQPAPPAATPGV